MHPHAHWSANRALFALVALLLAVVVSACGSDSLFNAASTSTVPPGSSDGTDTDTSILDPDQAAIVTEYAQAIISRKVSNAAASATSASLYLDYLARGERVGANVNFDNFRLTDDGFELKIGDVSYTFNNLRISASGVEDLAINGVALSTRLADVNEPVRLNGLRINSGVSYLTALGKRVVILTAINRSGADLIPKPSRSAFIQNDGKRFSDFGTLLTPERIPAGATAEVAFMSDGGNQEPGGLLNYVFDTDAGESIEISVPLGEAKSSFFQVDDDGSVSGTLSSDVGFATGSAVLSPEASSILAAAVEELANVADSDTWICVAGHADSVGNEAHNQTLSSERASAVRNELKRLGVIRTIDIVGHGERFAPGDEIADPESRRVDIRLEPCPS